MFSRRLARNLSSNRLHETWERKTAAGVPLLDLTASNPTRAGLHYPDKKILHALANPATLLYTPDPHGQKEARQAVATYYAERGEHIDPEALFLTASTSEAYAYLFKLLADPGQEILAPLPCYPLLDFLTALEGVKLRHYPLRYNHEQGWHIDLGTLENLITTQTVALVLVHPNNPTGSYVKPQELLRLNELCQEHNLALICDEVFLDYGSMPQPVPPPASLVTNRTALTFVLSGLSKIAALPQMKLGWLHVNGPEPLRSEALTQLEFVADTYLSAGAPVQGAAEAFLSLRRELQDQIQTRLATNFGALLTASQDSAECTVLRREGGWAAVAKIPSQISEEELAVGLLAHDNVLLHPGYFFDFPQSGFLVLSLLAPVDIFQEGITRVLARLRRYQSNKEHGT